MTIANKIPQGRLFRRFNDGLMELVGARGEVNESDGSGRTVPPLWLQACITVGPERF
ncbi:MAG: hypothetical protein ACU85E_05045 [Gammaproteobacteria bacterium]